MKRIVRRSLLTLVAAGALTVPFAGVMSTGNTFAAGKSDTVGNCISDTVYGNEPNMANGAPGGPSEQAPGTKGGNVVPTQSPGPWKNNPADPENPTRGRSVGQFQQDGINIPALCRAAL